MLFTTEMLLKLSVTLFPLSLYEAHLISLRSSFYTVLNLIKINLTGISHIRKDNILLHIITVRERITNDFSMHHNTHTVETVDTKVRHLYKVRHCFTDHITEDRLITQCSCLGLFIEPHFT